LSSAGERAITTWLEILALATFSGPSLRDLQSCSSFHSKWPLKRSNAVVIHVSPAGIERLSQLLWNYLATDEEGAPRRSGAGLYPESVFYASTGTYNLSHTCNTWTAEALRVTGLPVSATGVVFATQVLDQLPPLLEGAREHTERTSNSLPAGTYSRE
jgi:hypothetical protein